MGICELNGSWVAFAHLTDLIDELLVGACIHQISNIDARLLCLRLVVEHELLCAWVVCFLRRLVWSQYVVFEQFCRKSKVICLCE